MKSGKGKLQFKDTVFAINDCLFKTRTSLAEAKFLRKQVNNEQAICAIVGPGIGVL